MRYFMPYFMLCLKRVGKNSISVLTVILLLLSGLFLFGKALVDANGSDISKQRIKVGMTGDTKQSYFGLGFYVLENIDDSRFSIEFIETTEKRAERLLRRGEINAYIVIPDDFVKSLVNGENEPLSLVVSKSAAGLGNYLMREIADDISVLITESESGMYALHEYRTETGKISGKGKPVATMRKKYAELIFSRTKLTTLNIVGFQDSLSVIDYYICGILTLFLLIFGVSCGSLFADKNIALGKLLQSKRTSTAAIIMGEYSAFFALFWLTAMLVGVSVGFFMQNIDFSGSLFNFIDPMSAVLLTVKMLPFIAMLAAMQFFIFELASGIISGIVMQFLIGIGMAYVSGCFYPGYFFPETLQKVSAALPSGIVFKIIRLLVSEKSVSSYVAPSVCYTVLFLLLALLCRCRRLRRG